jgi:hypothetical protein
LKLFTGKGIGVETIQIACEEIFGLWDVEKVIACVRLDIDEVSIPFKIKDIILRIKRSATLIVASWRASGGRR